MSGTSRRRLLKGLVASSLPWIGVPGARAQLPPLLPIPALLDATRGGDVHLKAQAGQERIAKAG